MTDPLDVLRDPGGLTEPDSTFRARLMHEVRTELAGDTVVDPPVAVSAAPPMVGSDTDGSSLMEVIVHKSAHPPRKRYVFATILGAAAVAAVVVGLVVSNNRDIEPQDTVPPAAVATTTTVAPRSDADIAEAGLLTATEVGDNFIAAGRPGQALKLSAGQASALPACSAFVDSVFENAGRPATVRTRGFLKNGANFSQYVVVFPTEEEAISMMDGVADPTFPTCLGEYVAAAYAGVHFAADGGAPCCHADPFTPVTSHPLRQVGDQMVNIALGGRVAGVNGRREFADEGAYPFVRVGRAVVMFNPPASKSLYNSPGYPDAQLDQTLQLAVAKLRAAQTD